MSDQTPDPNHDSVRLVFGYRTVNDVPPCVCRDPGNYMAMHEDTGNPLRFEMHCWCGAKMRGEFDDMAERAEFLARHGVLRDMTREDGPDE